MEAFTLDTTQIESYEVIGSKTVYDISVDGNHNYYLATRGNPILVHNSGKSHFAAEKILFRLLSEKKHRFLIIRKVAVTLGVSVYPLLKSIIDEWGITSEFEINKTEKKFYHHPTGNEIICLGLDDAEKLKSIAGITSIWVEEATELEENDFDQLDLRLRGETETYKQIILTFNPIDERHWLKKRFYDNAPTNSTSLQTTYADNYFIDEEYKGVLNAKASVNENYFRIYARGEWGKADVQRPYCYNFAYKRHVNNEIDYHPNVNIRLSFDFNLEPFVCIVLQIWRDAKGEHIHYLDEITLSPGDIDKMMDKIKSMYSLQQIDNMLVTGDAMQRKREITQRDNVTAWQLLQRGLRISDKRLQLPRANPNVSNNRFHVNSILARHPGLLIHERCRNLINDLQFVEADEDGNIIKKSRANENQRADHLDAFRYSLNSWITPMK